MTDASAALTALNAEAVELGFVLSSGAGNQKFPAPFRFPDPAAPSLRPSSAA